MKDRFCSFCGAEHSALMYPKKCPNCGRFAWGTPNTAVCGIVPIADTLEPCFLGIMRADSNIGPAFPSGYLDYHEQWNVALARELWEECQVNLSPQDFKLFDVRTSTKSNISIVFGIHDPIPIEKIPYDTFKPNPEVSELIVVKMETDMVFGLHNTAKMKYIVDYRKGL